MPDRQLRDWQLFCSEVFTTSTWAALWEQEIRTRAHGPRQVRIEIRSCPQVPLQI